MICWHGLIQIGSSQLCHVKGGRVEVHGQLALLDVAEEDNTRRSRGQKMGAIGVISVSTPWPSLGMVT